MAITQTHSRMVSDVDAGSTYLTGTIGTAANNIVQLDSNAKVPTSLLDTGVTAGKVIEVDSNNKLPAVDGSQLTGISSGVFENVFSATNSGNQSIPSGSWTVATFDTENVDQGNNFASNKFTAPSAGLYLFYASFPFFENSGTGTDQRLALNHYNSSDVQQDGLTVSKTTVHEAAQNGMRVFNMSADDYINVQVYQASGGNRNLYKCQFFGWKVA